MATLRYSQVRAHPGGTIRYIANKDKIVSEKVHDVYNVLNYMGAPESTERVYSFGHHCSQNPDLAEKQVALHRARYYENKKGGVQGLAEGRDELLGLHFFMSYSVTDDPSEAVMDEILAKIAEHPKFRDFAIFGANHFDKAHKHTHFFVSQYSAEGKPRKLCMRYEDYNDLRRYVNRLCVERGLSIIDLSVLRSDPEYSDWLDGVIAEGKVVVHPEKEEHKRTPKQKVPTKNIYFKWMKDEEERIAAEEARLTPGKRFAKNYYYTPDGKNMYPISGDPRGEVYAIPLLTSKGRKRSLLELIILYIFAISETEGKYIKEQCPRTYEAYKLKAKVDWKLQGMLDCLSTAREMNVESPNDIPDRLADIGKQMNALRQEKRRHENSIAKHERIIEAYEIYTRVRPLVEGEPDPPEAVLSQYKEAYAVLVQNQILTAEAYRELYRRYEFEKRKVDDYDKRMPELNKQYRDLKRLEAISSRPARTVSEIFDYSLRAELHREETVDNIIEDSREKAQVAGRNAMNDMKESRGWNGREY